MKNSHKHILAIHPNFCIRVRKQIEGLLKNTNYKITLITKKDNHLMFPESKKNNIRLLKYNFHEKRISRIFFKKFVKKIANDVDIIHCHNEPDYHIVDVIHLFKGKIPIIYDIHDMASLRIGKPRKDEEFAYKNSDAIIHVSEKFIELGEKKYGKQNCYVIMNTPSKKYIQNTNRKKELNDEIHFVYQGGIYDMAMKKDRYSYRYYLPYFQEILSENHHIHVYTNASKERIPSYIQLAKEHSNFHFHGNLEYSLLMKELGKYNFGIVGFNFSDNPLKTKKKYLNAAIGNKLFDYLFTGIPVVVINAKEMEEFVIKNKCGFVKFSNKSWLETVKEDQSIANLQELAKQYSMENQIEKLVGIYNKLW